MREHRFSPSLSELPGQGLLRLQACVWAVFCQKHFFWPDYTYSVWCLFSCHLSQEGASLVAQMVKNLSEMQETQVQSLCWEDPLEEGIATHSSILAWRIPWAEEAGGLQSTGSKRVRQD